ncbi:transcriptional regulator, MarR family [Segniliparus rotundus DSM 44985]|uniref:Transcriptional regulator, MarR family n=1 Tax=Segniliparus rotundus (strain ATCC BAA-972 / CDC 1076 / CIP 108378 / DSM 44985 / JCM 13578) TaxID=640132 RepID=D6Z9Z5_SEGRD|nr:MarR family transcriptional regulator [Segniliparus rotundus]ADG98665.1 transcriptional regulator, MarR family [Segniliparus rotundus DSM 44985]
MEALQLGAQLCFAMYSTTRSMTASYRPHLEDMGLTYPQYLVLLALWEHEELTVKELGQKMRLDYGTVSPLTQRLEHSGLVERRQSEHDGRVTVLRASAASLALQPKALTMIESVFGGLGYTIDEIISLRDQINEYRRRLDKLIERDAAGRQA